MIWAILVGYFMPAAVALARKKRNAASIMLLDLFLGWTVIGWIIALIWAVAYEAPRPNPAGRGGTLVQGRP